MTVSFFILNNQVNGSFWWRAFWIIFITGKLFVLALTDFFAKRCNTFLVDLAKKKGFLFAGYQCFLTCHRVDGIPYEKDILSKYIKLKLMN